MLNIPGPISADVSRLCFLLGREFAVTEEEMFSERKFPSFCRARWALWTCLRERYQLSYPALARICNVDHTTVMHGVKQARKLEQESEMFRLQLGTARRQWLTTSEAHAAGERLRIA